MVDWITGAYEAFLTLRGETVLAWWGAILSTMLCGIKIWETVCGRFRVEVDGNFTTHPDIGHVIYIRNLSPSPIILVYWELIRRAKKRPPQDQIVTDSNKDGFGYGGCTIPPASTHTLSLTEEDHFSISPSALEGKAIYIRLHFAGRRPILRKIYPF